MKKKIIAIMALLLLTNCEAIFVEDISNRSVQTIAPSNGSVIGKGNIQFTWNAVTDATVYKLQIATPTFTNATQVVTDTVIEKTSFSVNLPIGIYQWRVQAQNENFNTLYTTNSFEID
jgi:hypothetical protein